MTKSSETPTQGEAPAKPRKMQVPAELLFELVAAVRAADEDSRRDDRVLHNTTRDKLADAARSWNAWRDEKMRGGL